MGSNDLYFYLTGLEVSSFLSPSDDVLEPRLASLPVLARDLNLAHAFLP